MKTAVGYIRVSTLKQEDSLEVQMKNIKAYCDYSEIKLIKVFVDEGVSGFRCLEDRPDGKKLVEMINSRSVDYIIATKLDRLFRNTIDALTSLEKWNDLGVFMNITSEGGVSFDTSTANGKFFFTIRASQAQFERDITSERTKAVLNHKKEQGEAFCRTPYGFDNVKENGDVNVQRKKNEKDRGRLVRNESEMAVVQSIFVARSEGKSFDKIAQQLNDRGVISKTGKKFHGSTVKYICDNDLYK